MSWWTILFSFSGRMNRAKYWLCVLIFYVSIFSTLYISIDVLQTDNAAIIVFPAVWIHYAAAIKRLHDLDKSGWWVIPWLCIPGGQIILGALAGTPGTNRFGPDPLATLQAA
jgi:uncharacterized membrane protein YhaH (DUF805 family)